MGGLRVQNGSGTDEDFGAAFCCQLSDHFDGAGDGHCDFDDGDAAPTDSVSGEAGFGGRSGADYGDDSNFEDAFTNFLFVHWLIRFHFPAEDDCLR